MLVIPTSNIKILRCPLELDNDNQINFASANDQFNYFNSLPKIEEFDYTYVRRDNNLRVQTNENLTYETLLTYNYVMYQNEGFSNKWFYAHITSYTWINSELTILTLEEDFFQSWQFDIVYGNSFIEREHVTDDTIGAHTLHENLETGEFVCNSEDYYTGLNTLNYIMQVTEWPTQPTKPLATNYGGVWFAGGAFIFDNISSATQTLQLYANEGKSDAVYNFYSCPSSVINNTSGGAQYSGQSAPVYLNYQINKPTTINGYVPKNNKLLTEQFNYLLVSNNNGSSNILAYERFSSTNCEFSIKGVPVVGASIKLTPILYDGRSFNEEQGLICGKFPTLNWSDDAYTNWLTQNSVNIGLGIATSAGQLVGGLATSNTGAVVGGTIGIAGILAEKYQHSLQPNSARGNVNGGDINICSGKNSFVFYNMSVKQENARIIDDYFEHYGYQVNTFKTLSITGRPYWNYVKTTMCNLEGNIPSDAMQKLKEMFNHGVTIWHNPANFLNYSLNNH